MRTLFTLAVMVLCLLPACSSTNRNIVSIQNSGVGLKVQYDPQTQLPDAWCGGIRSSINIVPVGLNKKAGQGADNANETPDMVSERVEDIGILSGIHIYDRWVLGHPFDGKLPQTNEVVPFTLYNSPGVIADCIQAVFKNPAPKFTK
jgi:hypothetical protein